MTWKKVSFTNAIEMGTLPQLSHEEALAKLAECEEDIMDIENEIAEVLEHGPIPDRLLFHTTAEQQLAYFERELARLREWRKSYLDLI